MGFPLSPDPPDLLAMHGAVASIDGATVDPAVRQG